MRLHKNTDPRVRERFMAGAIQKYITEPETAACHRAVRIQPAPTSRSGRTVPCLGIDIAFISTGEPGTVYLYFSSYFSITNDLKLRRSIF